MHRLTHLDALRGFAIVTMVAANMAPYFLAQPHPAWLRLYGSFAAPLFIGITGYLIALQADKGKPTRGHWLRGGIILLIAAGIDFGVWQIWPFVAYDVLYLIGVTSIFLPLICRWKTAGFGLATLIPIAAGLALQIWYPYDLEMHIPYIKSSRDEINAQFIIEQFFINGYFPMFPWLGVAAFGGLLYHLQDTLYPIAQRFRLLILPAATIAAIVLCYQLAWASPPRALRCGDYSELFYPPDAFYLTTALMVCMLFVYFFRATNGQVWQTPLASLGNSSMFFYLLHIGLIRICKPQVEGNLTYFLWWYGFFMMIIFFMTFPISQIRKLYPHRPMFVRMLIG